MSLFGTNKFWPEIELGKKVNSINFKETSMDPAYCFSIKLIVLVDEKITFCA